MQKLENNSKAVCKLRVTREKREPLFASCPQYLTCVPTSPPLTQAATLQVRYYCPSYIFEENKAQSLHSSPSLMILQPNQ